MFGLGKQRTEFGKWLDKSRYNQSGFAQASGVNRDTISTACSDDKWMPSAIVAKKIMKVVREENPEMRGSDFWDI